MFVETAENIKAGELDHNSDEPIKDQSFASTLGVMTSRFEAHASAAYLPAPQTSRRQRRKQRQ